MPFFSNSFDTDVEKATDENNVSENWALILDICDRANESQAVAKSWFKAIMRRLNNKNPHIVLQTLNLLNACVKNSGKLMHQEIASKEFVSEVKRIIAEENNGSAQRTISNQLKQYLKSWSKHEFKNDKDLSIIPSLYKCLKYEGISFQDDSEDNSKKKQNLPKDPNFVASQQEEDDIAKAIALSMQEEKTNKKSNKSLQNKVSYPSINDVSSREPPKVKALYDFEAAEDNELSFKAGDIIGLIDYSDENWWKGVSWRGEGLFPANFVSFVSDDDTKTEDKEKEVEEEKKKEHFDGTIDEDKINTTLEMIQNADPTNLEDNTDPENMTLYEEHCKLMSPMINQELEKIDRKHSSLMELNDKLHHALNMYHSLMSNNHSYMHASFYPPTYPSINPYMLQTLSFNPASYSITQATAIDPTLKSTNQAVNQMQHVASYHPFSQLSTASSSMQNMHVNDTDLEIDSKTNLATQLTPKQSFQNLPTTIISPQNSILYNNPTNKNEEHSTKNHNNVVFPTYEYSMAYKQDAQLNNSASHSFNLNIHNDETLPLPNRNILHNQQIQP